MEKLSTVFGKAQQVAESACESMGWYSGGDVALMIGLTALAVVVIGFIGGYVIGRSKNNE